MEKSSDIGLKWEWRGGGGTANTVKMVGAATPTASTVSAHMQIWGASTVFVGAAMA